MSTLKIIWNFRSTLFIILWPVVMLPIPLVLRNTEAYCGYCIALMVGYWITEVVPLAITAFLPILLFPLMGIMPASAVSIQYAKDLIWLFIGGLIIAIGLEHTRLHKRFALRILLTVGNKPQSLLLGFMLPTYILSMWMSNVAATAVMIPIAEAVLLELEPKAEQEEQAYYEMKKGKKPNGTGFYANHRVFSRRVSASDSGGDTEPVENGTLSESVDEIEQQREVSISGEAGSNGEVLERTKIGLTLCVPYAASIGGVTTLTGSGANLVMASTYSEIFPDADVPLSFSIWIAYHLPISAVLFVMAYFWMLWVTGLNLKMLVSWCKRNQTSAEKRVQVLLESEYKKLGSIKWSEVTVMIILCLTVLLWFFRRPGFMPGWSVIFSDGYVSDGTVAMVMAVSLFFLPAQKPTFLSRKIDSYSKPVPAVLNWQTVQRMMPWNVVFILGGGLALAEGSSASGFSQWLGNQLAFLNGLPAWAICLIVTVIVCMFTEFCSNTATASLFAPIIAELAQVTRIHPLYLLLPSIASAVLSFMLPVATPGNAIAFSYGRLKVLDLVKAGWMLNLLGIATLLVFINTYGAALFGLHGFPEWAAENYTSSPTVTSPGSLL